MQGELENEHIIVAHNDIYCLDKESTTPTNIDSPYKSIIGSSEINPLLTSYTSSNGACI
jgi:hypothetical protein